MGSPHVNAFDSIPTRALEFAFSQLGREMNLYFVASFCRWAKDETPDDVVAAMMLLYVLNANHGGGIIAQMRGEIDRRRDQG